jgi:hypothetical protein
VQQKQEVALDCKQRGNAPNLPHVCAGNHGWRVLLHRTHASCWQAPQYSHILWRYMLSLLLERVLNKTPAAMHCSSSITARGAETPCSSAQQSADQCQRKSDV